MLSKRKASAILRKLYNKSFAAYISNCDEGFEHCKNKTSTNGCAICSIRACASESIIHFDDLELPCTVCSGSEFVRIYNMILEIPRPKDMKLKLYRKRVQNGKWSFIKEKKRTIITSQ